MAHPHGGRVSHLLGRGCGCGLCGGDCNCAFGDDDDDDDVSLMSLSYWSLHVVGCLGMAHPHGCKVLGSLRKECGYGFVWVCASN